MNIAFMIGNGFDISLGLKTKYTDFYEYYFNKEGNSDNEIMKDIKKDIELWSNLEKALGEYTNKLKLEDDVLDKFYNDKYNLDCELREYLKKEQDRIDWDNGKKRVSIGEEFKRGLSQFYLKFNEVDRTDIKSVINEACYYKLISFNYTNVIEKIVEYSGATNIETLYIHGKLEESKTILGVNDAEQLANEELRDREEMLVSLCKLKINDFYGENIQNKAEYLLKSCKIVCVFGMSLGETDKHWWEYIVSNFSQGYIKRIIIFHYDHKLDINNNVQLLRSIKKVKNKLLSYSSIDENSRRDLEERIKVICNSNIFNFKLLFKDDSKVQEIEEKATIIESVN